MENNFSRLLNTFAVAPDRIDDLEKLVEDKKINRRRTGTMVGESRTSPTGSHFPSRRRKDDERE